MNAPTSRTTVKRLPERGHYDDATVAAILDAATICHIGFVVDDQPYVIPTICARSDANVYVHGSPASRMLRTLDAGADMCLTATVVDGLVLARSSFHHSINYRSVVVLGRARKVTDRDEKAEALRVITDHVVPGRYDEARVPTDKEVRSVNVLALSLEEASAKVRTGPANDEPDDYDLPIWAGVVPVTTTFGVPVPDDRVPAGTPIPASVGRLTA
ncbi:MAG TPA: pyridoxamine 5'-phosphate oxidase family protein [Acidimicrobiales bacterium]|jgi:nitroimidazol reductase NimA-like FMN-containing flavoprotein (pyridoxamine 5'-phosphate oxidase superfamily)|nr:pyridoxamine 5'-phosphate oxidase family protein [Acidimicrobiales bacterium]